MKLTDSISKALSIAYQQHHGQRDKGNCPYIFHPYNVAEGCHYFWTHMPDTVTDALDYETLIITALLHDVVEDTNYDFEDIDREFPGNAALYSSLVALTKLPGVGREHYISHIATAKEPYPLIVKIMDIQENMRPDRVCGDIKKQAARNRIYAEELGFLKEEMRERLYKGALWAN